MTARFQDWSPASVFGATASAVHNDCHGSATKDDGTAEVKTDRPPLRPRPRPPPLPFKAPPRGHATDFAARVIQKRVRVWLLYRYELDSLSVVGELRQQLVVESAGAIRAWYRRYRLRRHLVAYAEARRWRRSHARHIIRVWWHQRLQDRRRDADRKDAHDRLVRWWRRHVHQQRVACQRYEACMTTASMRIACWWRWLGVQKRCDQRGRQRRRSDARRVIVRYVWRHHCKRSYRQQQQQQQQQQEEEQRIRKQAAATLQNSLRHYRDSRGAKRELTRRRRHRRGMTQLVQGIACALLRIWLHQWVRIHTQRERAASILQRWVRVQCRRDRAIKQLQLFLRGQLTRWRYQRQLCELRAAIHAQRLVRGFLARQWHARWLAKLRERFRCRNCGLIEPGGVYCKFCGRRRMHTDALTATIAATASTTEQRLQRRRQRLPQHSNRPVPPSTLETGPCVGMVSVRPSPRAQRAVVIHQVPHPSHVHTLDWQDPESSSPSPGDRPALLHASPLRAPHHSMRAKKATAPRCPGPGQATLVGSHPGFTKNELAIPCGGRISLGFSVNQQEDSPKAVDHAHQRADVLLQLQLQKQQRDESLASPALRMHMARLTKGAQAASR